MKPLLEQDIQHAILRYLKLQKCVAVKAPAGGLRDRTGGYVPLAKQGTSDILAFCPIGKGKGIGLAIEVKRPGNTPTKAQQDFLDDVNDTYNVGIVATSIDEVDELLRDLRE